MMEDFLAARSQMAVSLGFHIVFASIGMAMPFLMAIAHWRWLKTEDPVFRLLTKAWSRGVALFFATGAVSGTVLSFELGLLWPGFMKHAGPIIGMPFSWEGTAFFLEAIALGLFLYGWKRLDPWVHWMCGVLVGITGVASAFFVIAANGWMNSPQGFHWVNGEAKDIDPLKAMFNPALFSQSLHMILAAFVATGFAVAGVHAVLFLKSARPAIHREAIQIALWMASIAALLQPLSGDLSAKFVAKSQPEKFAAMESLFETQTFAPLALGGIPDESARTLRYSIEIPGMLSFLAFGSFHAEVQGLNSFPPENLPPLLIVHLAYQCMVGIAAVLATMSLVFLLAQWKKSRWLWSPWFLKLVFLCTPLGFVAIEAGWIVTEVGRQPWIIYKVMRTRDALTPMPGLIYPFLSFSLFYLLLSFILAFLMKRQILALEQSPERI